MRIKAHALQDAEQEAFNKAVETIVNYGLKIGGLGIAEVDGLSILNHAAVRYFKAQSHLFDLVNDVEG